jgi:hypothetical protein
MLIMTEREFFLEKWGDGITFAYPGRENFRFIKKASRK